MPGCPNPHCPSFHWLAASGHGIIPQHRCAFATGRCHFCDNFRARLAAEDAERNRRHAGLHLVAPAAPAAPAPPPAGARDMAQLRELIGILCELRGQPLSNTAGFDAPTLVKEALGQARELREQRERAAVGRLTKPARA